MTQATSKQTEALALSWLSSNMEWMRKRIRAYVKPGEEDDVWDDVVLRRLPSIIERYDPAASSLKTFVNVSLRWYISKWRMRRSSRMAVSISNSEDTSASPSFVYDPQSDTDEEISKLLERLESEAAWLVRKHVCEGYTFAEIAKAMGCSSRTCGRKFAKAMQQIREESE